MSGTKSTDYVRYIAEHYADDFHGYRMDILHREDAPCWHPVEQSLMENKRTAVSSGHGPGKTAFDADAIHWYLATRESPAIIATANTEGQLQGKLWRELYKTNQAANNGDWFDWKASTFTRFNDPLAQAVALPWSENNPEAFAGTHERDVLGVFDEASRIARAIFNTFGGAMTTPGARWLITGNPTRAEGYFFDAAHGKFSAKKPGEEKQGKWASFIIPSFASPFVTAEYVQEMKDQFGEESDEYRIRVLGLPPKSDVQQFIPQNIVLEAQKRVLPMFDRWPLIIGCDVGRGDRSVMVPRRGRKILDAIRILHGERTTDFARRIADEIKFYREEEGLEAQVIIEELGMGVGVVEMLQDWGYSEQTWGVNTGNKSNDPDLYLNLRCEMWGELKEWLEGNVEIPNDSDLYDDLVVIKKKSNGNSALRLETKEEMRKRGVRSPDVGDAAALTFAVPFELLPEKRDAYATETYREASDTSWMAM